jgi:hypothetical protein
MHCSPQIKYKELCFAEPDLPRCKEIYKTESVFLEQYPTILYIRNAFLPISISTLSTIEPSTSPIPNRQENIEVKQSFYFSTPQLTSTTH